jgi:D-sedoheptulose 7-phosphate isomerase
MKNLIKKRFDEARTVLELTSDSGEILKTAEEISKTIIASYAGGGKVFIAGNGGSAADAQHIAAELVSRFYKERKALAAESLSANTSNLTAIANDYDFSSVFSRQLEANARKDDVFWAISTSGNSKNIISAINTAKNIGMKIIGFTGKGGGKMAEQAMCEMLIRIPSNDTPRIQENHILIAHIICEMVENAIAG